jgi:oligopeptide/dipeptide ABC transporter ATP-binding protein
MSDLVSTFQIKTLGGSSMNPSEPLLKIRNLKKYFPLKKKGNVLHAVDDFSIDILPMETVGLVGESGCGKSTVGNVLVRLLEATSGQILFEGQDVVKAKPKEMHELKKKMQMIFQDPYSSLNPRETIGAILADAYQIHNIASGKELKQKVADLAESVGLEAYILEKFPHELDGGKRQLTGIARALSLNPKFIVCDEPVSALDVSVQAKIINLLISMKQKMNLSYLFISHDLSVVRHIADRVAIMYLGQIVELAPTDVIFENTLHPYSIALLSAVPQVDFRNHSKRIVLKGDVPSPINPKPGCRFAPRCWMAHEKCKDETPQLSEVEPGHQVACHFWSESREMARRLVSVN